MKLKDIRVCGFLVLLLGTFGASSQTVGLFQNDAGSLNGYTLFNPIRSTSTYLIDNCGRLVNEWESEYTPGNQTMLLENGNLLRTASSGVSSNPTFAWGGAGEKIQEVDWEGNVIWEFTFSNEMHRMHHDFARMPNGNLLIPAWELKTQEEAIEAGRDPDLVPDGVLWAEFIIEVEAGTGEIVWEWHMWDHLVQDFDQEKSNYGSIMGNPQLLDINVTGGPTASGGRNWLHINSIDYNAMMDQIVINSFFIEEFYIIDHSTTTAQAAGHAGGNSGMGGDLLYRWGNPQNYDHGTADDQTTFGAHNVHWIPGGLEGEGNIMLFNNGVDRPDGSYSSIDVIVPPVDDYLTGRYLYTPNVAYAPESPAWSYSDQAGGFYSSFLSGAQRLSNGNTFICSGANGRFFEIDENMNIVWEYINPVINDGVMSQGDEIPLFSGRNANIVFRATRYGTDFPGFANVDLTAGDPIELNFTQPYECEIIDGIDLDIGITLYPNPAQSFIIVESETHRQEDVSIYDSVGKLIEIHQMDGREIYLNVSNLQSGTYFVKVGESFAKRFLIEK